MRNSRGLAMKVALTYAAIALAWILASDYVVSLLPPALGFAAQATKGAFFVFVTAIVLYILVERLAERLHREAMHASSVERMLGQVVSSVPVGVVLTSDDGTVTFLNATAESMVGLTSSEAVGRFFDEVCCSDGHQSAAALGELMRVGSMDEVGVGGRGGEPVRRVLARAAQIDPGVPASGWVFALSDISETQKAAVLHEHMIGGYRFLAQALEICNRATDEGQLLRKVAEIAVSSHRYLAAWAVLREDGVFQDVATVGMGEGAKRIARVMHGHAESGSEMPRGTSSDSEVIVSNDLARDPANIWHPASMEDGFGSIARLVVHVGGRMTASLMLFAREAGAFDASEVEMLNTLLGELSFSLGKLRLERKRLDAEQEVEHGERGYRTLFETNPAPMWVYDRENLSFLAVNDAAVQKYGYSRAEFLGMTIGDIRPRHDMTRLIANVGQVSEGFEDAGVWTHVDKQGREFPVQVYSHTVDWSGRPAELVMALEVARIE